MATAFAKHSLGGQPLCVLKSETQQRKIRGSNVTRVLMLDDSRVSIVRDPGLMTLLTKSEGNRQHSSAGIQANLVSAMHR